MEQLIVSVLAGALGANAVGAAAPKVSLGTLGNSIAGILGGGLGGQVLSMLGAGGVAEAAGGGLDIASIIGSLASGGVGGGIVMAVIGVLRNLMANR